MTSRRVPWGAVPAAILVVAAAVVPLVGLLGHSLRGRDLLDVWSRPGVTDAIRFSLGQGALSAVLTLAVGSLPAWALSRFRLPGRRVALTALTVPFVLPTVVVGAAFLALLPDHLDHSLAAVLAAHVFFNVSVVVRTVVPAWSAIDERLIDAARTLGASPTRAMRTIAWPLVRRAAAGSAALVFFLSATSFGVVRMLGGPNQATVDVEIYRRAVVLGDVSGAAALGVAQTLLVVMAFAMWTRRSRHRKALPSPLVAREPVPIWLAVVTWTIVGAFAVPVIALVLHSFRGSRGWSTTGWRVLLGERARLRFPVDVSGALTRSVVFALLAAAIAVPIAVGAARAIVRSRSRVASIASTLPLGPSAVVVGFGVLVAYDTGFLDIRGRWWLVPVVHACVALPFAVRAVVPLVEAIPSDLGGAAATLGASPLRRWFDIDRPLLRPALATATAFSLAVSLGEFGATSFLTRRGTTTVPILVDALLGRAGAVPHATAFALSTVLLLATTAIVTVVDRGVRT